MEDAITLAIHLHKGQKRKSGEDYVTHPLRVMEILKTHNLPEEVLVAAVLHDVCEDTEISNHEIVERFSPRVGFILYALSKNNKPMGKNFSEVDFRFLLYVRRFFRAL